MFFERISDINDETNVFSSSSFLLINIIAVINVEQKQHINQCNGKDMKSRDLYKNFNGEWEVLIIIV